MRYFAILMVFFLTACSPEQRVPSKPGAYLIKVSDAEVQLIVVTEKQKTITATGSFRNEANIPPALGRLTPGSVSGIYEITTTHCGKLHFFEGKGIGLFCKECEVINANRGAYGKCEISKINIPPFWIPIGF